VIRTCVALASLLAAVSWAGPAPTPDPATAAHEAATWLEERMAELREGPPSSAGRRARELLAELRETLVEAGLDEPLARALVPVASSSGDDPLGPLASLGRARSRLESFAEASRRPTSRHDPEASRQLSDILNDPIFLAAPPEASMTQRLGARLRSFFGRVFGAFARLTAANPVLALALFVLVVGAALAALSIIALRLLQSRRRYREPRPDARTFTPDGSRSPELMERARGAVSAGLRLEALRLLTRAAVVALRTRGELPDEPGLTALESARILESREAPPALRRDFDGLVAIHDRGVYGGTGADGPALEQAMAMAERLIAPPAEVVA